MTATTTEHRGTPATAAGTIRWLWPLVCLLEVAVFLGVAWSTPTVPDNAWLMTLSERFLDGARLYVDLIEVNPPMSVYLYVPLVAMARVVGLSPDSLLPLYVAVIVAASLTASGHILRRAGLIDHRAAWWAIGFAAIALFPLGLYGQREQFVIALMLPGLALAAARMADRTPSFSAVSAVAVATGLGVCVKPHFALAVVLPALVEALRRRSLAPLLRPEHWIGAAVVACYAASVVVFQPAFVFDLLPLLAEIYLPMGSRFSWMLWNPHALAVYFILAGSYLLWRGENLRPIPLVTYAAATGFLIAFLVQGKAWAYQNIPTMAVVLIGVGWALRTRIEELRRPSWMAGMMIACFGIGLIYPLYVIHQPPRGVHLSKVLPQLSGASVNVITADIALGHPVVRQIGGTWAGRSAYRVVAYGALDLKPKTKDPARKARLDALAVADRRTLLEDLKAHRPDVILAHTHVFNWLVWARVDPEVAAELDNYVTVERIGVFEGDQCRIDVLLRRDYAETKGFQPLPQDWTRRLGPL